jgi:hypothetical protein
MISYGLIMMGLISLICLILIFEIAHGDNPFQEWLLGFQATTPATFLC